MRFVAALGGGLGVSIFFFLLMESMISAPSHLSNGGREYQMVDFIRMDKNLEVKEKERLKKELPKPKTLPKIPKTAVEQKEAPKPKNLAMDIPDMMPPLALSKNFSMGDASFAGGAGMFDGNVIPLVRIPPQYPMRAKRLKIEGYVVVQFIIDEAGAVERAQVVKASPEGIFEKAALRAIKRWKFKPKSENGVALKQGATQTIEFKLDQ